MNSFSASAILEPLKSSHTAHWNVPFIAIPCFYSQSITMGSQSSYQGSSVTSTSMGQQQTREHNDDNAVLVNPKQYQRILKRRISRSKLERKMKPTEEKKEYLHESRHKHACRRPRGPGGRFLTKAELEAAGISLDNIEQVTPLTAEDEEALDSAAHLMAFSTYDLQL